MLVVTRKLTEAIEIPSLNVSLAVQSVEGRRVRLAVSAPPEFPLSREEVATRTNPQSYPETRMEGVRILLADGDSSLVKVYATHLSLLGFEVATAESGVECFARLRDQMPHLVVLDAGLLWGRAAGVLAVMKEHTELPAVPVLMTYDRTCEQALPDLYSFHVSDYAEKPLTPSQLAQWIRELLAFPSIGGSGRA
ncbi:carbon storage regulator [Aeoliella sp.]|uniref:carbon storage regulator n=1 Tax=Aeoliella sp. TaxID=2795800 RepID=UPI002685EEC8|nr:response regulator [bacterium]